MNRLLFKVKGLGFRVRFDVSSIIRVNHATQNRALGYMVYTDYRGHE